VTGDLPSYECPLCDVLAAATVDVRAADISRLGGGGFITEFGACSDSQACLGEIERVTANADRVLQSWAYWQFKYFDDLTTVSGPVESFYTFNGSLQENKVAALSRTYAPVVAGSPVSMKYDPSSKAYRLRYITENSTVALLSEIYLNRAMHYSTGADVRVLRGSLVAPLQPGGNFLAIQANSSDAEGSMVDVAIVPVDKTPRSGSQDVPGIGHVDWTVTDSDNGSFGLVCGSEWRGIKVVADDGHMVCFLQTTMQYVVRSIQANTTSINATSIADGSESDGVRAGSIEQCVLIGSDQHAFLFAYYRIEFWHKFLGTLQLASIADGHMFGPLLGKSVAFEFPS